MPCSLSEGPRGMGPVSPGKVLSAHLRGLPSPFLSLLTPVLGTWCPGITSFITDLHPNPCLLWREPQERKVVGRIEEDGAFRFSYGGIASSERLSSSPCVTQPAREGPGSEPRPSALTSAVTYKPVPVFPEHAQWNWLSRGASASTVPAEVTQHVYTKQEEPDSSG